jgi:hypothetical protein
MRPRELLFFLLVPLWVIPRDSQSANAAGTEQEIAIVLTGQSMIRSDIRVTAPAGVPVIQSLLNDDVMFTNLELSFAKILAAHGISNLGQGRPPAVG